MGSSEHLFRNYKGDAKVFVESGTGGCDGIQNALNAGGFKKLYTCEIYDVYAKRASERFKDQNVIVLNEPSTEAFPKFFNEIDEKCLIWLDGHSMPYDPQKPELGFGNITKREGLKPCPLIEELSIISNHKIKNHTILIDDTQDFGTWVFGGITEQDIDKIIFGINTEYKKERINSQLCYRI
jgi:hypothetical protein